MGDPYIGEIRMFGGSFAPVGWALCNGQLMPISENDALFALIGTTYGGDGQSTFGLPNLQSRIPIHMGQGAGLSNRVMAETIGVESVTLSNQQMPVHNHPALATATGQQPSPEGAAFATPVSTQTGVNPYLVAAPAVPISPQTIQAVGGSQPHDNMQPYLVVTYIISLFGIFPSQS
jgi:microcystin-dependent protein